MYNVFLAQQAQLCQVLKVQSGKKTYNLLNVFFLSLCQNYRLSYKGTFLRKYGIMFTIVNNSDILDIMIKY